MAQPYDYILAKYIEIGKRESKYIGHSYYLSLSSALEMAKEEFGNTYTGKEYNIAMINSEVYVLENYANNFTRIPD